MGGAALCCLCRQRSSDKARDNEVCYLPSADRATRTRTHGSPLHLESSNAARLNCASEVLAACHARTGILHVSPRLSHSDTESQRVEQRRIPDGRAKDGMTGRDSRRDVTQFGILSAYSYRRPGPVCRKQWAVHRCTADGLRPAGRRRSAGVRVPETRKGKSEKEKSTQLAARIADGSLSHVTRRRTRVPSGF